MNEASQRVREFPGMRSSQTNADYNQELVLYMVAATATAD